MSTHELSPLNNPEVVGAEKSLDPLATLVLDEFATVVSANSQRHKRWPQYMLALSMVLIACTTDKTESPTPWSTPTFIPSETLTSTPTGTSTTIPTEIPTSVPTETATIAPTETPTPVPTLLPPNRAGGELPIWLDEETGVEPTAVVPTTIPVTLTATPGATPDVPAAPATEEPTATATPDVPPATAIPPTTEAPVSGNPIGPGEYDTRATDVRVTVWEQRFWGAIAGEKAVIVQLPVIRWDQGANVLVFDVAFGSDVIEKQVFVLPDVPVYISSVYRGTMADLWSGFVPGARLTLLTEEGDRPDAYITMETLQDPAFFLSVKAINLGPKP